MKKLLLFVIGIFYWTFIYAQPTESNSDRAVQQAIINAFEALSKRDSSALRSACTSDVLFIEYGTEWNIDTLIRRAITQNRSQDFRRVNTLDFISTTVKNDMASVVYRNKADISSDGKQRTIEWIESIVAIKENNRWKIKLLHSTQIKRE